MFWLKLLTGIENGL